MFSKFLEKLAGKAGLDNIRADLTLLKHSFPHDSTRATKFIFAISDQICFAFANHVARQDVKRIIDDACQNCSNGLPQVLDRLFVMDTAIMDGDQVTALRIEQEMRGFFLTATGVPLDYGQRTFFQKITQR